MAAAIAASPTMSSIGGGLRKGGRGEFAVVWRSLAAEDDQCPLPQGPRHSWFGGQEGGKAKARRPSPPLSPTFPFLLMGLSRAQGFAFLASPRGLLK
jgi:hypothetical protein